MELTIIQKIAIWAIPLIFAITLHEVSHGYVASLFGDQTARYSGRLTLNPIKHIDLIGTILVPLAMLMVSNFIFGWAKPVPVDPRNMRHPRSDMAFVALAGPCSNILMAFFWGFVAKMATLSDATSLSVPLGLMGSAGIMINVILAVLNLLPLPPLDGGTVFMSILPPRAAYYYSMIEPYGFWILLILIFTNILIVIMSPFVYFLINLIGRVYGLA